MALYNEKIGEFTPDNLIASLDVTLVVKSFTAGEAKVRGEIINASGSPWSGEGDPFGIVCDDVAADVGTAYVSGIFNRKALEKVNGALTEEKITALRKVGIFVENAVG